MASASRARSLTVQTAARAKQARLELLVIVPLLGLTIFLYARREQLFGAGADTLVRVVTALAMVGLGLFLARDLGRWIAPALFRRMDAATAGTVAFLIRLVFTAVAGLLALRIAGLDPATLAVGGAITAVVVGSPRSRRWAT
jgi:small conductance mechanosensitive channel